MQGKDTTLQEAITAASLTKNYYVRLHTEEEFDKFYESCVIFSEGKSGQLVLPRYRRTPARFDDGVLPHRFQCPKDYYRVEYYEACVKIKAELESRFNQSKLSPVINVEKILMGAKNGYDFSNQLEELKTSFYKTDIDCGQA